MVEGLDKRGATDIHVKKQKAKRQGRKKPHFAGQEKFNNDSITHGTGSSPVYELHVVPDFSGDTAPTPDMTSQVGEEFVLNETVEIEVGPKLTDDEKDGPERRGIFIQPAQTIPRVMGRREGVVL